MSQEIDIAALRKAAQVEYPHEQMDAMALARYKVGPAGPGVWSSHAVRAGNGERMLWHGRKADCENVARRLTGAFLDGGTALFDLILPALLDRLEQAERERAILSCAVNHSEVLALHRRLEQAEQERDALERATTVPMVEKGSQQWAGMSGAVAHHLIERHAENWADVDMMMAEWADARAEKDRDELQAGAFPMQPIHVAEDGCIRFKKNRIVDDVLEHSTFDMNQLAWRDYTDEERMQFAQLIGYSVSGYGNLSYASPESVSKADEAAEAIRAAMQGEGA